MRMIDEDEVGLKEKPEDTRYIKIRPEAPGVWAKDLINLIPTLPLLGTVDLVKVQRCATQKGVQSFLT